MLIGKELVSIDLQAHLESKYQKQLQRHIHVGHMLQADQMETIRPLSGAGNT